MSGSRRCLARMSAYLLAAALVLSGASLTALAADAKTTYQIVGIEISGNDSVPTNDIMKVMKIAVGDTVTDDDVKADQQAILKLGKFSNVVPKLTPFLSGYKLVFEVYEYPRVNGYRFEGNTAIADKDLARLVTLRKGDMLDTNVLDKDLSAVIKAYDDKGLSAGISGVSLSDDNYVTVQLVERRLGSITIKGNVKTKTSVIQRELDLAPGELVNQNRIRENVIRIYRLGLFDDVVPSFESTDKDDVVNLVIQVKESRTANIAAGLGYSTADGLLGYVRLGDSNFGGNNQKLNLSLEIGRGSQNYEVSFLEPWFAGQHMSFGLSLYNRTSSTPVDKAQNTETRRGGQVSLGKPLSDYTSASLVLKVEDVSNSVPSLADGSIRSLTFSAINDTRDDQRDSKSGGTIQGSVEVAGGLLDGDYDFQKYQAEATRFFTLGSRHTLAIRGQYGTSSGNVPSSELYSIGGADSVRGTGYASLTGQDMAVGNVEYRYRINDTFQAVGFFDIGGAWNNSEPASIDDLCTGVGAGVRINTPIGIIRLDYGVSKSGGQTYFSLGQMF